MVQECTRSLTHTRFVQLRSSNLSLPGLALSLMISDARFWYAGLRFTGAFKLLRNDNLKVTHLLTKPVSFDQ